jgi:hypothetical protein
MIKSNGSTDIEDENEESLGGGEEVVVEEEDGSYGEQ